MPAPSVRRNGCNVWQRLAAGGIVCWGGLARGKIKFLTRKSLPMLPPLFILGHDFLLDVKQQAEGSSPSKLLLNCMIPLMLWTLEVGGTSLWQHKQKLDKEGKTVGVCGIPEHLLMVFWLSVKIQAGFCGRTELDPLISQPTLLKLVFCLLFFRNLVSDKQDSLAQCADFRNSLPSQEAMLCSGPLAVIQGRTSKYALPSFHQHVGLFLLLLY